MLEVGKLPEMKAISEYLDRPIKKSILGTHPASAVDKYIEGLVAQYGALISKLVELSTAEQEALKKDLEAKYKGELQRNQERYTRKMKEVVEQERADAASKLQEARRALAELQSLVKEVQNGPLQGSSDYEAVLGQAQRDAVKIKTDARIQAEAIVQSARSEAQEMVKVSQFLIEEQAEKTRALLADVRQRLEDQGQKIDEIADVSILEMVRERNMESRQQLTAIVENMEDAINGLTQAAAISSPWGEALESNASTARSFASGRDSLPRRSSLTDPSETSIPSDIDTIAEKMSKIEKNLSSLGTSTQKKEIADMPEDVDSPSADTASEPVDDFADELNNLFK